MQRSTHVRLIRSAPRSLNSSTQHMSRAWSARSRFALTWSLSWCGASRTAPHSDALSRSSCAHGANAWRACAALRVCHWACGTSSSKYASAVPACSFRDERKRGEGGRETETTITNTPQPQNHNWRIAGYSTPLMHRRRLHSARAYGGACLPTQFLLRSTNHCGANMKSPTDCAGVLARNRTRTSFGNT
jgi:hypothetical protein